MLKAGVLYDKNKEIYYQIVNSIDNSGYIRYDIFDRNIKYNQFDTSNCIASYFRTNTEGFLGNKDLIDNLLREMKNVQEMNCTSTSNFSFEGKDVIIEIVKTSMDSKNVYKSVTKNTILYKEYYETPNISLQFTSIDNTISLSSNIYNRVDYSLVALTSMKSVKTGTTSSYYSWSYLKMKYQGALDHLETYDYIVVQSVEEADRRLDEWINSKSKYKGVDTETTGLDMWMYGKDCVTGVVLAQDENTSTYYPFRQENIEFNLDMTYLVKIVEAINSQPEDVNICWYNYPFDVQAFYKETPEYIVNSEYALQWYGENVVIDKSLTQLIPRCDLDGLNLSLHVNNGISKKYRKKNMNSLKYNSDEITGLKWLELSEIFIGKVMFNKLPLELVKYYACPDGPNTIRVVKSLLKRLPNTMMGVEKLDAEILPIKGVDMEFFGLPCDEGKLDKLISDTEKDFLLLENTFKKIIGTSKNIKSNNVKREIFYNKLGCSVRLYTNTGAPSVSSVAILDILKRGVIPKDKIDVTKHKDIIGCNGKVLVSAKELASNKYYPLVILDTYNGISKNLSSLRRMKKHCVKGRISFYMIACGADSDRETSDAHQYNDLMKSCIIGDSQYHGLVSCDYSQVELRILSYLAGEEQLNKLEAIPYVDIHRAISSKINNKPMYMITAAQRKYDKSTNFGVAYDMSKFGLAKRRVGISYDAEDLDRAEKDIDAFYRTFDKIAEYKYRQQKSIAEKGYVETDFKYRRNLPDLLLPSTTKRTRQSLLRSGYNTKIQGFGASLLKIAQCNYHEYIYNRGWNRLKKYGNDYLPIVRLMLSIHDEVLISYDKDEISVGEIIEMCKVCQEIEEDGAPPFFASPAFVNNWADGKSSSYEMPILYRDELLKEWRENHTCEMNHNNYLECLEKYKIKSINSYMKPLIDRYKTIEEVAKHVTHDDLTHTLISVFCDNSVNKNAEQEEFILNAVTNYMNSYTSTGIDAQSTHSEYKQDDQDKQELQEEMVNQYMQYDTSEYDEFSNDDFHMLDDKGNEIIDSSYDDIDDLEYDDEKSLERLKEVQYKEKIEDEYVFYTINDCIIDLDSINNINKQKEVNIKIFDYCKQNIGRYKVKYIFNNNIVDTGYYVIKDREYEINTLIRNIIKEDIECE